MAREIRFLRAGFFVFVAVFLFGGRARADDVPTVADVRAKIKAASGAPLASSYERISYTRSGIVGSQTTVRSGEDFRKSGSYGPFKFANGRYQKQDWHQNSNGQTVFEQPDPPRSSD